MAKRTNGEGTIYQRPNGLWCAELTLGYDEQGKRIKKSFYSMDLERLQKEINDAKVRYDRNLITQKNSYTIEEWVRFWLENYKIHSLKSKTFDNYEYALEKHIKGHFGDIKLDKVKPSMIQQLYNSMQNRKFSTSTIKKVHVALNQSFEQAIKNELMFTNPCNAVTIPKIEKRKAVALSVQQQESFEQACRESKRNDKSEKNNKCNLFLFALDTGMRIGEIIALIWDDVDMNEKIVNVSNTASTVINRDEDAETKRKIVIDSAKTDKSVRTIPMTKRVVKIIEEQKDLTQNKDFIFSSRNATILMERNLEREFHRICDKAGLDKMVTIHTLRHTFASRMIERKVEPKALCDLMGHSSIQVTYDVYGHMMLEGRRQAMSLLDGQDM